MKKSIITLLAFCGLLGASSCDKNNNLLLFGIEQDKQLGQQVSNEINNDPSYNILSESQNREAYAYLEGMRDEILNSGAVEYKDDFAWELKIIDDQNVLNAFATPGGYIYVYTGLIKYLEDPDDLAGVMGHEIAHADLRHTSRNLQNNYGIQILLSIISGQADSELSQIALGLATNGALMQFSQKFEKESDLKSVEYLAGTKYRCDGAATFFQKLEEENPANEDIFSQISAFFSTHPQPADRADYIPEEAEKVGCSTKPSGESSQQAYDLFKSNLGLL
ncbi:M48 family metalloprotease [Persicobacter sp. CCB-QB2]|uniref:M48 family metalloprotease n=1 Tax=Persicobacter sp. CCB-QB2 TaxID=1561025 RepID=UPI0006A9B35D|nr:M48 family metalloprotease [Persicobacter sp. CCB-QB2]